MQGQGEANNETEEVQDMRELKLMPTDAASRAPPSVFVYTMTHCHPLSSMCDCSVEPIFEALSLCAALHPDPQGSEDDMDDAFVDAEGGGFETFTGDETQELSEVGRVRSNSINNNRYAPY